MNLELQKLIDNVLVLSMGIDLIEKKYAKNFKDSDVELLHTMSRSIDRIQSTIPHIIDDAKKNYTEEDMQNTITTAVEKALLDVGKDCFDAVVDSLYLKYQYRISDCYKNPSYLNLVLKDLYGDVFQIIVDSIKINLDEIKTEAPVSDFILEVSV